MLDTMATGSYAQLSYEQGYKYINAVLDAFPGIGEEGCFFHLYKWLDVQLKRLGLMPKYQTDDDFKLRVKMLELLWHLSRCSMLLQPSNPWQQPSLMTNYLS